MNLEKVREITKLIDKEIKEDKIARMKQLVKEGACLNHHCTNCLLGHDCPLDYLTEQEEVPSLLDYYKQPFQMQLNFWGDEE